MEIIFNYNPLGNINSLLGFAQVCTHSPVNTECITAQNYRSVISTFFYILLSIFFFLIMFLYSSIYLLLPVKSLVKTFLAMSPILFLNIKTWFWMLQSCN